MSLTNHSAGNHNTRNGGPKEIDSGTFGLLYSVTRDNALLPGEMGPSSPIGSRTGLTIANGTDAQKELIRTALFGDGTNSGSLISKALIGGTGVQNPLKNFTQVLNNLGIATGKDKDHQNHFHVYLSPPTAQAIVNSLNLLAPDAASANVFAGGAESPAVSSTETTTYSALSGAEEVIMLAFTVPAEPPSPPALIAQASGPSSAPKQDVKTVTFCRDTESLSPESAFNSFSPISTEFRRQIGAQHGRTIEDLKQYRVTLVESPKHGTVENDYLPSHSWIYRPTVDYKGTDRVIFLVESQSKQYKVVVNFWVVEIIDENRTVQECESINFGTQNGSSTTVSGITAISLSDFEAWQREAQLSSLINTVSNTTISFADLPNGAIGQTTGSIITLDTNAANYETKSTGVQLNKTKSS